MVPARSEPKPSRVDSGSASCSHNHPVIYDERIGELKGVDILNPSRPQYETQLIPQVIKGLVSYRVSFLTSKETLAIKQGDVYVNECVNHVCGCS